MRNMNLAEFAQEIVLKSPGSATSTHHQINEYVQDGLEHECRVLRSAPSACDAVIQSGMSQACAACKVAFFQKNPELTQTRSM